MNLLETVCAVCVFSLMAGATLAAWETGTHVLKVAAQRAAACECARDAAERWMRGDTVIGTAWVNGELCRVEEDKDLDLKLNHIVVTCEAEKVDVWIPF